MTLSSDSTSPIETDTESSSALAEGSLATLKDIADRPANLFVFQPTCSVADGRKASRGMRAYAVGMSRLSCSFCILASRADLRRATELRPDLYRTYAELERRIGHTLSPTRRPLPEVTRVPLISGGGRHDLAGPFGA